MGLTLYEIADDYRRAVEALDEGDESAWVLLSEIEGAMVDKIDNIAALAREADAEAEAYKAEADRLTERRRAAANRASRLKAYMAEAMHATGAASVKGARFSVSLRSGPASVSIVDEASIPPEYAPPVTVAKPDKRAILEALKRGDTVPGAVVVEGRPFVVVR